MTELETLKRERDMLFLALGSAISVIQDWHDRDFRPGEKAHWDRYYEGREMKRIRDAERVVSFRMAQGKGLITDYDVALQDLLNSIRADEPSVPAQSPRVIELQS